MSYITPAGRASVRAFVYAGEDRSLLYKYALSRWAQWLVDAWTPIWVAPNLITLTGLLAQLLAFLVMYHYSGTFTTPPPPWACLLACVCLFMYSSLDNMDGKQARRTGSSSALGLLFDHGCDAVNAGLLGPLILAMNCSAGAATWQMFAMWTCATVPFFMNTWEEFHLQVFILPIINGPNEGLMALCGVFLISAVWGANLWSLPAVTWPAAHDASVPWWQLPVAAMNTVLTPVVQALRAIAQDTSTQPMTNLELAIACSVTAMGVTVAFNTMNVLHHVRTRAGGSWWDVVKAMGRQAPMWGLLFVCGCWLQLADTRAVAQQHPYLFMFSAGCLFVDYTSKLMVSHACDQKYRPFYGGLIIFAGPPLLLLARENGLAFLPHAYLHNVALRVWLLLAFVSAATSMCIFAYEAINELAEALGIAVFDITAQLAARDAKAAAAAAALVAREAHVAHTHTHTRARVHA